MNKSELNDLGHAIEYSRKALEPFRRNHIKFIKSYVGWNYGDVGVEHLPLMDMFVYISAMTKYLSPMNPRAKVRTKKKECKPFAYTYQEALCEWLNDMEFGVVVREVVLNSLFSIGIMKMGYCASDKVRLSSGECETAKPYAESVSMDDWFHDVSAGRIQDAEFYGNFYDVDYKYAMESGLYENKDAIKPDSVTIRDENGNDKVVSLTTSGQQPTKYRKSTTFADVWIPKENVILTFPKDKYDAVLRETEVEPEQKPYRFLFYDSVPGNSMPVSSASVVYDLIISINQIYNRARTQAIQQKTVGLVPDVAAEDADRIITARHGQFLKSQYGDKIGHYTFPGPPAENMAFLMDMREKLNKQSGNYEVIAGLGPQSGTLGQDQMILQNASVKIRNMEGEVLKFMKKCMSDAGYMLWKNEFYQKTIYKKVLDTQVPVEFTPDYRKGEFNDYDFDVEPYSQSAQSPSARASELMRIMERIYLPMMPLIQQSGKTLDFDIVSQFLAENLDKPELLDILTEFEQPNPAADMSQFKVPTKRTYERISRKGAPEETGDGLKNALSAMMKKGREE